MLTSAAQPSSHLVWLRALTHPAAERRGQQWQLLHDLEEGVYWADLVLPVGAGLVWRLPMAAARCLHAAGMLRVSPVMSFLGTEVPNRELSSSKCQG